MKVFFSRHHSHRFIFVLADCAVVAAVCFGSYSCASERVRNVIAAQVMNVLMHDV